METTHLLTVTDQMDEELWPIVMEELNKKYPLLKRKHLLTVEGENGCSEIYYKPDRGEENDERSRR